MEVRLSVKYLVYGETRDGQRTLICETDSARVAKTYRDAGNTPWERTVVHGPEGELSKVSLDRLAELKEGRDA